MVWHYSKPLTSSGSKQGIFFIYLEFTSKDKIPIEQWQILNMMWAKKSNILKEDLNTVYIQNFQAWNKDVDTKNI